jgi:hypothetical protein
MQRRNLEQRCAIKFCVKLNENATETYEKLKLAKVGALVGSDECLIVTMIRSELILNHQTVHDILKKEQAVRTLGHCITTTLLVTRPSP